MKPATNSKKGITVGNSYDPETREAIEDYLPALEDLAEVLTHCPIELAADGWELSEKLSDIAVDLEALAVRYAPTSAEIAEQQAEAYADYLNDPAFDD